MVFFKMLELYIFGSHDLVEGRLLWCLNTHSKRSVWLPRLVLRHSPGLSPVQGNVLCGLVRSWSLVALWLELERRYKIMGQEPD